MESQGETTELEKSLEKQMNTSEKKGKQEAIALAKQAYNISVDVQTHIEKVIESLEDAKPPDPFTFDYYKDELMHTEQNLNELIVCLKNDHIKYLNELNEYVLSLHMNLGDKHGITTRIEALTDDLIGILSVNYKRQTAEFDCF